MTVVLWREVALTLTIVDYVSEMTAKKSCKYGEYGYFQIFFFLLLLVLNSFWTPNVPKRRSDTKILPSGATLVKYASDSSTPPLPSQLIPPGQDFLAAACTGEFTHRTGSLLSGERRLLL